MEQFARGTWRLASCSTSRRLARPPKPLDPQPAAPSTRSRNRMSIRVLRRVSPLFIALWLFVIFVSVFDGYLAIRFRDDLHKYELNPLGRMLIQLNGGQVWL